jgi:hypothetical protein
VDRVFQGEVARLEDTSIGGASKGTAPSFALVQSKSVDGRSVPTPPPTVMYTFSTVVGVTTETFMQLDARARPLTSTTSGRRVSQTRGAIVCANVEGGTVGEGTSSPTAESSPARSVPR